MLLVWDLGISGLVIVVCLVIPVIGLLVRRQWRLAAARREEIGRLLFLASEEAARAELEASFEYTSVSVSNSYHCPVCYCPATTRCSRCKAVRYCSGKCQIVHWRQGHKDECRPARITFKTDHDKSSDLKVRKKGEGNSVGEAQPQHAKPDATPNGESVCFSDATIFAEDINGDITDIKDESLLDKEEAVSVAETSGSSFSGFSSSPSNDSSDDVSLCESSSSSDSERSEAPLDADIAVESVETCFGTNHVSPPEPLSPKFTHLVQSADNFNKSDKLNQCKPGGDAGGNQSQTSSLHFSVMDRDTGLTDGSPMVSSGFWGRTLESVECASDSCDGSASSELGGAGSNSLSGRGSSLHFAFSSFQGKPAGLTKFSEVKSKTSDKAPTSALEKDKSSEKVTSSERIFESSTRGTSGVSHASCGEGAKTSLSTSSWANPTSVVRGFSTCSGPLDPTVLSSVASGKSKSTIKENGSTFDPLRTGEVNHLTSRASNASKVSGFVEHSPFRTEPGRQVAHLTSRDLDANKTFHNAKHSSLGAKSERVPDNQKQNASVVRASYSVYGKNGLKASVLKVVDQWAKPKSLNQCTTLTGNEMAVRHGHKALFPYESFAKLYNWNKLELLPCGLINCGNSCYANVVLQCLMFTPPLTAFFLQGLHSTSCQNKEHCFTCGFEDLVLKAKEGRSRLSPNFLLSQLQNIGIRLGNGKEEDAHEFLRFAVDAMQSTCIKESGYDMLTAEMEETTLIGMTFGGYLRSKIKCMKCQGNSEQQERMMDLTVEIDGDVNTLDEALRKFTRTEILDGENKYKCGRCKSYEKAKKKLKILEPPNVLTIALKRFQSGKFGKLNKSIRFQETLDLAPYVSGRSGKSHVYRLYGVIVHLDIMNAAFSGHYVCYIRNNQNKWYKADDTMVVTSEAERVLTKGAYMLFYARCSPRPPRSVCSKTVSSDRRSNVPLPKTNPKSTIPLSRSVSSDPSVARCTSSLDGQTSSIQSFYSKFHRLQRILEEDSTSDSSSLFDGNSDECSCSTDSTRDSSSMDDFADFIFGDVGRGYGQTSYSDTSSSSTSSASSPSYRRHSPFAESDDKHLEGNRSDRFLHSDLTKPYGRILGNSSSSSSISSNSSRSGRDTDMESERITRRASPLNDARRR